MVKSSLWTKLEGSEMNLKERMRGLCDRTKKASYSLASENTEIKNKILRTTADNILDQETRIREENKKSKKEIKRLDSYKILNT